MRILLWIVPLLFTLRVQAKGACDDAVTTPEINQCAQAEHQKSDKALNSAYQAALKRIESGMDDAQQRKETRQKLVEAQRYWVQFRDKDCGAVYDLWQNGTIRGAMYWSCMTARTETRTKELQSFANQQY